MGGDVDFEDFYRAVNGRSPFPWQARLAARLADGGGWPSEIGVPTGLGKTACVDIAVWWLASEADLPPERRGAPTRIWWLVNRRLLVDATSEHVDRVARLLAEPDAMADAERWSHDRRLLAIDVLRGTANRLRGLAASPDAAPLEVVRLRGGAATGRPTDPSQPAVLLATLPMYGSRLLFRGYGTSRSLRPVDAALAGTDALVLVDEAHLARHLMGLFGPLADCEPRATPILHAPRQRPTVVSLTATGGDGVDDRFDLDEQDLAHPVISQRLDAPKPTLIVEHRPPVDAAAVLADAATEMLMARTVATSCVVFANTPDTARKAFSRLSKSLATGPIDVEILLLTGRTRAREGNATRRRILDPESGAPATRDPAPRARHLVVVATQTLEVGADVDFELLATEACGVRALTQRLGRLNRLGRWADAEARYVHAPPKPNRGFDVEWPVYGAEPLTVLERLKNSAADGSVELGPSRVSDVLGPPLDDSGRAPEVMPGLLWEWAKTSQPPLGEAPVEPFFSGLAQPDRRVAICWRAHVPEQGDRIWPRVREDETIDVPLSEVREVLSARPSVLRLASDRVAIEMLTADELRPGDTVVIPVDAGLMDDHGWAPEATSTVVDSAILSSGLPLDAEAVRRIAGVSANSEIAAVVMPADDDDTPTRERVDALLSLLSQADPAGLRDEEWLDFLGQLHRDPVLPRGEVARLPVVGSAANERVDELDELSLSDTAVALTAHGGGVGGRAEAVAAAIGLDRELSNVVGRAGRFHDVGKADERFQRWLDPSGKAPDLVAKSDRPRTAWTGDRVAAGWPAGGRHEALSGRLACAWLDANGGLENRLLEDLMVHLVVSHHGHARPLLVPVDDDLAPKVSFELDGVAISVDGDLSEPDWAQPARFRRLVDHYGHWGLALLEAIVRQSDHAVSAGGWAGGVEVV